MERYPELGENEELLFRNERGQFNERGLEITFFVGKCWIYLKRHLKKSSDA